VGFEKYLKTKVTLRVGNGKLQLQEFITVLRIQPLSGGWLLTALRSVVVERDDKVVVAVLNHQHCHAFWI
jgi:hypothetical protein